MIEHAIRSLITGLCDGRVYYVTVPQNIDLPYIVISKISSLRHYSLSSKSGLVTSRLQLSVFAESYWEAKQIAREIQAILENFQGESESIKIQSLFYDNEVDLFDEEIYQIASDYTIWHIE